MSSDITTTADTTPAVHEKGSAQVIQPTTAAPGVAIPATPAEPAVSEPLSPLDELYTHLPAMISSTNHSEMWGVELTDPSISTPTQVILQKYLNANDQDVARAKDQLTKSLAWRAKMKPLELTKAKHSREKFSGLGYVTVYQGVEKSYEGYHKKPTAPESKEIFTWNIYGNVTNIGSTFGVVDDFIAWRIALMELALEVLSLKTARDPITATYDPYKITQVHDYKNISFLRQSPAVKTASKETIEIFSANYPELLKEKFFVNVPAVMGFVYGMIKVFVAEKTRKKFHPMSNGGALANEFGESTWFGEKSLVAMLPATYGGKGEELAEVGKEPMLE